MSLSNLIKTAEKHHSTNAPSVPAPISGGLYPLDKIKQREQDTRPLNEAHVIELAESIAALGLIESLALDCNGRLLAGGHRLAAIHRIREQDPDAFNKQFPGNMAPARIFDFDADKAADLALQIEIAENEKRRDYTPSEVRALADRLREAGYVDLKGRPREGQKALTPALSVIIGKSIRTVRSYLNESEKPETPADSGSEKSRKAFLLLQRLAQTLSELEQVESDSSKLNRVQESIPAFSKRVEAALSELRSPNL